MWRHDGMKSKEGDETKEKKVQGSKLKYMHAMYAYFNFIL